MGAKPLGAGITILLLLSLLSIGLKCSGEEVVYIGLSKSVYDLGQIVQDSEFNEQALLNRLRTFAGMQASRHRLSRLSVVTKQADLPYLVPGLSSGYPFTTYTANRECCKVAQVVCFNGSAIALLRIGKSIRSVTVMGHGDPRNLRVGNKSATIMGIVPGNYSFTLYDLEIPNRGLSVTLHISAQPMLSLDDSRKLMLNLMTLLPEERLAVIIRPDSLFAQHRGPAFDVFSPTIPKVSRSEVMKIPYIFCYAKAAGPAASSDVSCSLERPSPTIYERAKMKKTGDMSAPVQKSP